MDNRSESNIKPNKVGRIDAGSKAKMNLSSIGANEQVKLAIKILTIVAFIFITVTSFARPIPQAVHEHNTLKLVGQGKMTWFGFTLYHASLWTAKGDYSQFDESLPIALHITYERNFKSTELAEATVDEWERLEIFDNNSRQHWGNKLANIWPDIKQGDSITTFVTKKRHTIFFANDKKIGHIKNPTVSYALLSIWLHPDTTDPELRRKLIGKIKA